MKTCLLLLALLAAATARAENKAANGTVIPSPISKATVEVKDGGATVKVPANMVFVPAGKFTFGDGTAAREVELAAFASGASR